MLITLKCSKFLSASVLGSIQVVSTIKDFKTFKKFQKMTWIQKNSNPYQIWIYYYSLDPKAYGTPNAVWTGKLTKEDIIKMDCESIFNTKKRYMSYTISIHYLDFVIFFVSTYCHWFLWRCGVSWNNFQKEEGGYRLKSWWYILYLWQLSSILTPFSSSIFSYNKNVTIKNYQLSLKV